MLQTITRGGGTVLLLAAFLVWYLYMQTYPRHATVAQDELWAATLSALSFVQAFVFILRWDIHPPLYYMQLNLWSWVSQSDAWLQVNSMLWLLATAAVVVALVKRRAEPLVAYATGAFVLSSPYLVYYGFELRMYTLLAFLAALGVWFTEKLIEQPTRGRWTAVILTYLAAAYTHALAPLVIPCHFVYGLFYARRCGQSRSFFVRWFACNAFVSVLSLPVFINSVLRSDSHAAKPTFDVVVSTLTQLLVGTPLAETGPVGLVCLMLICWMVCFALTRAESRSLVLSYVALPIVSLLIVSLVLRPVWLARPFLFSLPILGVALGRASVKFKHAHVLAGIVVGITALQVAISIRESRIPKEPNYATLAAALKPLTRPGDAIVVLKHAEIYWGMARYFAGPRWGDGLRVGVPPSENWARILTKLPTPVQTYLTRADRFDYQGVQIIGGHPDDLGKFRHVFFVGYTTDEVPPAWRAAPVVASNGDVTVYGPLPEGAR